MPMETINPKVGAFVRAAKEDPERFWAQAAATLPWHRHWDHVLEWDPEHPDERDGTSGGSSAARPTSHTRRRPSCRGRQRRPGRLGMRGGTRQPPCADLRTAEV